MTKLAMYESSNEGMKDRRIGKFFKTDYISYQNFITRLGITLSLLAFFLFDLYGKIATNLAGAFDLNYKLLITRYVIVWVLVIAFYSFASTIVYNARYKKHQERLEQYKAELKELDVFSRK